MGDTNYNYLTGKIDQKEARGRGINRPMESCGETEYWNKVNSRALVSSTHFTEGDWGRKLRIFFNSVKKLN